MISNYLPEWNHEAFSGVKSYPENENTWEPVSAVEHLRKLISSFHKDYPEKPTATFAPVNSTLPIAKPTTKLISKQKRGRPANSANKKAKKNWTSSSLFSHMTSCCLIILPCLLSFSPRNINFSSQLLTRLGGFFINLSLSNNYPHLSIFPPQLAYGVRRVFASIDLLVFLLFLPIGLGGFLPSSK